MTRLAVLLLPLFLHGGMTVPVGGPGSTAGTTIDFPVPKEPNMLFYLQRTPNENTVIYALRLTPEGTIAKDHPVDVYWRRFQEDGRRMELDFIQRTFAYGVRTKDLGDKIEIRCIGHDKVPIYVYKHRIASQPYRAMVVVNDRAMFLDKIFLEIDGGTFWFPNVKYAEFSGSDPATGAPVVERYFR